MADKKISQLTAVTTPLATTVEAPVVQSGATKKATVAELLTQKKTGTGIPVMLDLWGGADGVGTPDGAAIKLSGSTGEHSAYIKGYHAGFGKSSIGMFVDNYGGSKNPYESFTFSPDGNLIPKTAAKGINFTANTPAAGMTSQLLNWYEEGTWTPVLSATTTPPSASYANRTARYTRVGRLVTIHLWMNISSQSGGSGDVLISGLPFTSAATGAPLTAVTVGLYQNIDPGGGNILAPFIGDSSTSIVLGASAQNGGGYTNLTTAALGASNIIIQLTATYIV